MSDLILFGVLRMPPELWCNDEIDIAQRHTRYVEAADRITELEARVEAAFRAGSSAGYSRAEAGHENLPSEKAADLSVWLKALEGE